MFISRRRRALGEEVTPPPVAATLTIEGMTFTAVTPGSDANDIRMECRITGPQIDSIWSGDFYELSCDIETTAGARPSGTFGPLVISHDSYSASADGYEVLISVFGPDETLQIASEDTDILSISLATDEDSIATSTWLDVQNLINSDASYVTAFGGDGTLVEGSYDEQLSGGEDPVSVATALEVVNSLNSALINVTGVANTPAHVVQPFAFTNLSGGTD